MRSGVVYAVLWSAWIGAFLAIELTALATGNSRYTLSDFVWRAEQVNAAWSFLRYFTAVFCVWLFFHMAFGWFK